ncbi:MAG: phosphoglucosamine mutase [Flavobacteriales bacterium]|nr:phosphoglucosamine mutase [Flavobacteriales bacterium]
MTLIRSISGIRGTIGGKVGEGLSPLDVVKFTSAYATFIKGQSGDEKLKIIVGRDARISGQMVNQLVIGTLMGCGMDVIDLGLSTTPTVEVAVVAEKAHGGIILTASHNPKQWNALKLLNEKGEFISAADGENLLQIAEDEAFDFADVNSLGSVSSIDDYMDRHIKMVLDLALVDVEAIKAKNYHVAIDCVNSTGGIVLPKLLKALGVNEITELFVEPTGEFPHNPEPLPEHLTHICEVIKKKRCNLGIVVDPDVDRLALVCEDGEVFGEEYTLVAVADHVLKHKVGNTVSNLSSTRALRDVTEKAGGTYHASAVGEVNVVEMMKATNAVIGGEGNGGVIYPELHYGRDALVGIALFLTHLAKSGLTTSRLRATYPSYHISKNKISLDADTDVDAILKAVKEKYSKQPINTIDGVKIEFDKEWVHLRKSNTEPIIRIYSESRNASTAENLANRIITDIKEIMTFTGS